MKAEVKHGIRITLELETGEAEKLLQELGQGTYGRGNAGVRLYEALGPAIARAREAAMPAAKGYWEP